MKPPFTEWLIDAANDVVLIQAESIHAEARSNAWSFALETEDAAALEAEDVEEFIHAVVDARRKTLIELGCPRAGMVFYCWFDETACQLRFSLVSATNVKLPFGCEITDTPSLSAIACAFLGSEYHEGIPLSAFESDGPVLEASPNFPVALWRMLLP